MPKTTPATWEIVLTDGRTERHSGRKVQVDDHDCLLILDGFGDDGLAFAAGPTGWISCTPIRRRSRTSDETQD